MRERHKSLKWILWAVIASFVALIFVGWGLGGMDGSASVDAGGRDVALEVDGRPVTRTAFLRELRTTEEGYRRQFGEQAEALLRQFDVREQVKNSIVTREVALREARRARLAVTDAEVRDYVLETFVDAEGRFVGREQVERGIRRMGFSDREFQEAVRDQLLLERFQESVEAGAVVSEAELREEYLRRNDKVKLDSVYLDARALAPATRPDEAALRAFFEERRDRYAREERQGRYVVFTAAALAERATAGESELREEYARRERLGETGEQRRARHILLSTREAQGDAAALAAIEERARDLAARARGGESFETLAAEHSQDPGSARQGGDLGFFAQGRMVKPFEEAAFALAPGEVSEPVQTTYGWHVIKLEEVRPARTFEQLREELVQAVRERKALELARAEATQAAAAAGGGKELAQAAPGLEARTSPFLAEDAREAELAGVEAASVPAFVRALFALPEPGKSSADPVAVGKGFAVLQLAERRGPVVPPFEAVRARVEQDWTLEQGMRVAEGKAAAAEAALAKGGDLAAAAAAAGAEVKGSDSIGRAGGLIPGIPDSRAALEQAATLELRRPSGRIVLPGGIAFLQVNERFEFDPAAFEGEKERLRAELERNQRLELWTSLIRSVRTRLEQEGRIRYLMPELFRAPEAEGDTPLL